MDENANKMESNRHEEALESFRQSYKEVRTKVGKNWCILHAFKKAGIEDENNMSGCLSLVEFKPYHLIVGNVYSDRKAPIGTLELSRADDVRTIIIAACLELKPGEAAVVGTLGKINHHYFAVLGVQGGYTVHHSMENHLVHPRTGVRFKYSLAPEFFDVVPACGDRVILYRLQNEAGKLLNGKKGRVCGEFRNGRMGVKVDGFDKVKSIRPEKLVHCVTEDGVTTVVPEDEVFHSAKEQSEAFFGKDYTFTPIDLFLHKYCRNRILNKDELVKHFDEIIIGQVDFEDGSESSCTISLICPKRDIQYYIQVKTPERPLPTLQLMGLN